MGHRGPFLLVFAVIVAAWTQAAAASTVTLSDVSCASPGACAAVGTASGANSSGAVLYAQSAGAWSRGAMAGLPADAGAGAFSSLASVSCPAAGSCVAAGSYAGQSGGGGLLVAQTAGTWGPGIGAPLPADAIHGPQQSADLRSVTCLSAGECVAVGRYTDATGASRPLAITETGGTWGAGVPIALPSDATARGTAQFAGLQSVSCPSAGNCTAVGGYSDAVHHVHGLLVTEINGTWARATEVRLPGDAGADALTSPSGHFNYGLNEVVCRAAGECTVVGEYANRAGLEQGLLVTEHRGQWSRGIQPRLPANAATARLHKAFVLWSGSCTSAGNCTVVGWYEDRTSAGAPLVVTERNGSWQRGIEPRTPANAATRKTIEATELESISCASTGNCTAVGSYTAHGRLEGLLLTESHGRWGRATEARLPAGAREAASAISDENPAVYGVACAAAGSCSAIGTYDTGPDRPQGMLLTQARGVWGRAVPALF